MYQKNEKPGYIKDKTNDQWKEKFTAIGDDLIQIRPTVTWTLN